MIKFLKTTLTLLIFCATAQIFFNQHAHAATSPDKIKCGSSKPFYGNGANTPSETTVTVLISGQSANPVGDAASGVNCEEAFKQEIIGKHPGCDNSNCPEIINPTTGEPTGELENCSPTTTDLSLANTESPPTAGTPVCTAITEPVAIANPSGGTTIVNSIVGYSCKITCKRRVADGSRDQARFVCTKCGEVISSGSDERLSGCEQTFDELLNDILEE